MNSVNLRLETKLQTRLALTPEIKTALELLQLPQVELEQRISEELEQNPLLEWDEAYVPSETAYDAYRREGIDFSERTDVEDFDRFERATASAPSLHAHLDWQVTIAPWPEADKALAQELIPLFDPDGYLRESDQELAAQFETSLEHIASVRALLQTLEPAGLAARNLAECLLLQLSEHKLTHSPAAELLSQCCHELERGDMAAIQSKLGWSAETLNDALKILRNLDPSPGYKFRDNSADPIEPELRIEKTSAGTWRVEPYKPYSHRIRRSPVMLRFQNNPLSFSAKEREFIRQKVRAAEFFLNSLKQRELMLLRVSEAIVRRQYPLLEQGPTAAVPLTLKDIAEELGVHESTISRATRRKYAITPNGLLELKEFFRQSVDGRHTPDIIKNRIKALVQQENPTKPLSDQALAEMLSREGIDVARRTVAKYRGELSIPGRSERRQPKQGTG